MFIPQPLNGICQKERICPVTVYGVAVLEICHKAVLSLWQTVKRDSAKVELLKLKTDGWINTEEC